MHMSLEQIGDDADALIEECMKRYQESYPYVDTVNDAFWDFRLVLNSNMNCMNEIDYEVNIYVWQRSDEKTGKDTCKMYEFNLELAPEDQREVKRIAWEKMGEMLLDL